MFHCYIPNLFMTSFLHYLMCHVILFLNTSSINNGPLEFPHDIVHQISAKCRTCTINCCIAKLMCKLAGPLVVLSQSVKNNTTIFIELTYLRVLRMRRVVRILSLLRDQCWVELLVAIDIARVNVLRWLAISSLHKRLAYGS